MLNDLPDAEKRSIPRLSLTVEGWRRRVGGDAPRLIRRFAEHELDRRPARQKLPGNPRTPVVLAADSQGLNVGLGPRTRGFDAYIASDQVERDFVEHRRARHESAHTRNLRVET